MTSEASPVPCHQGLPACGQGQLMPLKMAGACGLNLPREPGAAPLYANHPSTPTFCYWKGVLSPRAITGTAEGLSPETEGALWGRPRVRCWWTSPHVTAPSSGRPAQTLQQDLGVCSTMCSDQPCPCQVFRVLVSLAFGRQGWTGRPRGVQPPPGGLAQRPASSSRIGPQPPVLPKECPRLPSGGSSSVVASRAGCETGFICVEAWFQLKCLSPARGSRQFFRKPVRLFGTIVRIPLRRVRA